MKRLLASLFITFLTLSSFGQVVNPVEWTYQVEKGDSQTATLVFKADIDMNWHLYSQNFAEGGPLRTTFHFEESPHYKLVGETREIPEPEKEYDETFEMEVKWFSDQATFRQKIKLTTQKSFKIEGNVEYQACQED